jgi:phospho-N-acetylmuramoyl-pentapeptide-transferase
MFYHLLYPLHTSLSAFNVFKYITFRAFSAAIFSLLFTILSGPWFIKLMQKKQIGQSVRDDGPESHLTKKGTPTMGGLLIIISTLLSTLLWADLSNRFIWICTFVFLTTGIVGGVDDALKVIYKNSKGISGKQKLFWQSLIALAVGIFIYYQPLSPIDHASLRFPFFKHLVFSLGFFYIPFVIFVIVGASNAVNLTDGLDGLASGPIITTATTFALFSYLSGNSQIAEYLQIPYIPGAGEVSIFCTALAASQLGFLWFNAHPADIFMGDVGSLPIGAALGTVAVITKNEILLALVGGIFVIEALSVMIQVFWFKRTKKRIFKMAPIHHHFELKGIKETKVVIRFWIISILLAIIGLTTLKLR